jgi:Gpi18-like mannosyltransferase
MKRPVKILLIITSLLLILVSLYFRYEGLKFISNDVITFIFPWYEYVEKHGLWEALGQDFLNYNYSPAYLYLIALAGSTSSLLNRGSYTKLFGFVFDVFNAFVIYKIVFHKYKNHTISLLAASLFFTLPTIILNSSYWGQADNVYTSFLLCCVYFILSDQPIWAAIAWGLAFSFKLQAIFLLPFLLFAILIKKMKWQHLLLSPLVYLLMMVPTIFAGRPMAGIFSSYLGQSKGSPLWVYNSSSIYSLFISWLPQESPDLIVLPIVGLIILAWVLWSVHNYDKEDDDYIMGIALGSVAITPFLLPHMHERYFYPADVFSLTFAFYVPRLYVLPIFFQISSYLVYRNYLFYDFERTLNPYRKFWGAFINLISILILLSWQFAQKRTWKLKSKETAPAKPGGIPG